MGTKRIKSNGVGAWYALVALAVSTLFVLTVVAAAWLLRTQGTPTDFASFWAAGRLVLLGEPSLAYDAAVHREVQLTVTAEGGLLPFAYPPPFLLAVTPFGFHPYWLAYLAWMAVTSGLYLAATRRFLAPRFAFAHPATLVNAAIGQNGFLTSSILLFGLSALATQPFAAGAIFGLLVIKPQLAILIPVALLAGREWRAIGGAAVSTTALITLAAFVFGLDCYVAFLSATTDYAAFLAADRWNWVEQASVFGFFRFFGVPHAAALSVHVAVAIAAALITWRAWSSGADHRGAVLAAATLLVPPYVLTYDSLLLVLPLAVLLRDPAHPWRPAIVWACVAVPLFGYVGLYPGPNTIPVAAGLCLWWVGTASKGQKKSGGAFRHRRPPIANAFLERAGDVAEGRAQRVTNAGHRTNRRNGDQSSDQAILDGGRTLFVLNQFQKLGHVRSP